MYFVAKKSLNKAMIYAETPRLVLRSLERHDLPRVAELIGVWDVARWLSVVPHPYTLKHAEEFYERMQAAEEKGVPEYFLLQQKNGEQIGAIGLHSPRENPTPGKLMIGYWLGKNYWGKGYMIEAIQAVLYIAFQRPNTDYLVADANVDNQSSQNVLRKAGFQYLGIAPCRDPKNLRGDQEMTCWKLTRDDYEKNRALRKLSA